ncbi:MAG: fibronectin type III domain-containing protein [Acidobacteria bacterium]|nr:fibronectin type III domain-containing protein [Acidobacteriota bacterium]
MKREWKRRVCFQIIIVVTTALFWEEARLQVAGQGPTVPVRPVTERSSPRPTRWDAGVTVSPVEAVTVAGRKIQSSSKLKIEWRPITGIVIDHYEVEASESIGSSRVQVTAPTTPVTLTGLKSGTPYTVTVRGCHDVNCRYSATSIAGTGTTSEEHWQIQGTGNSYSTASRIVSDGNIGSHAFRYGSWAGTELAGRLRLPPLPRPPV